MNNDPYDDKPLGMIDEEFFEEIALKQSEPTVDEIRDMWILSAQEHPELFGETFFKKELSPLEALSKMK